MTGKEKLFFNFNIELAFPSSLFCTETYGMTNRRKISSMFFVFAVCSGRKNLEQEKKRLEAGS